MWRHTKEEIGHWFDVKEINVFVDQNKNPWINTKKCLQRYVFTNLHEIFFVDFPSVLVEWIQIFFEQIGRYQTAVLRNWTHELIQQVNGVTNKHHV
jgi:hypothetical protein